MILYLHIFCKQDVIVNNNSSFTIKLWYLIWIIHHKTFLLQNVMYT